MSNKKWTPGPWGADDNHGKLYIEPLHSKEPVAIVCKKSHEELYANARIISSAPDMYEALEYAVEVLRDVAKVSGLTHSDAQSCADAAYAIICKARGEK